MRTIFDLIVKTTSLSESFQKLAKDEVITRKEFTEKMRINENMDPVINFIELQITFFLFLNLHF